jgi:hypothetical protein
MGDFIGLIHIDRDRDVQRYHMLKLTYLQRLRCDYGSSGTDDTIYEQKLPKILVE